MTPDELARAFLTENPCWIDIDRDTGGMGLCGDASKDFAHFCREHGVMAEALWMSLRGGVAPFSGQSRQLQPHATYLRFTSTQGWEPGEDHCVTWLQDHGVAVDLTARQYDETFDFPFIWAIDQGVIHGTDQAPRSRAGARV